MPAYSRTSKRVVSPPPFSRRNNPREEAHPQGKREGFDAETGKRKLTWMRFYLSSLLLHSCLCHAFALCPASESLSEPPVTTQP
jgi:hypothetical protein